MHICVFYRDDRENKQKFEISLHSSFRGAVIYKAGICRTPSQRTLRRCAKKLGACDVSFVAVGYDCLLEDSLASLGFSAVSGRNFVVQHAAEMALAFAEKHGFSKSFFVRGGSFFTATRTVLRLFEETDRVFLSSVDFDAVAEAVADTCGAVLRKTPPEDVVILTLTPPFSLRRGDVCAEVSDFLFSFNDFDISGLPAESLAALAETFKLCGFLGDKDIKCELLSK